MGSPSKTLRRWNKLQAFLALVVLVLTLALIYVGVALPAGLASDQMTLAYGIGSPACFFLFAWRLVAYGQKRGVAATISLAFFDVVAYLSFLGGIIWAFILPVIRQFPATMIIDLFYSPNLPIGVYSLVLGMGLVIVIRALFVPFTRPPSEQAYGQIEAMLAKLNDNIYQMGKKLEDAGDSVDPTMADKVTSMVNELSAVRRELSSIKSSGGIPTGGGGQGASGFRVMAPPQAGVREAPKEVVAVVKNEPLATPQQRTASGKAVPDSMVDNPWLTVLARRGSSKREADGQGQ